jgi:hypothetical protein
MDVRFVEVPLTFQPFISFCKRLLFIEFILVITSFIANVCPSSSKFKWLKTSNISSIS